MTKYVAPTVATAFSCPHCGALAKQHWYTVHADRGDKDYIPVELRTDLREFFAQMRNDRPPKEVQDKLIAKMENQQTGNVFIEHNGSQYINGQVGNLSLSRCFNCDEFSVWLARKLIHPVNSTEFQPAENMPDLVKRDFVEAAKLFSVSPRSSAALLRVAIEQLCNEINGKKMSIFKGIGLLVENGLEPKIQKALDYVRVTGNDAVHPGQITPNDTPDDARKLFALVNLIVDHLITRPLEIDELYGAIPELKRDAIEKRDEGKRGKDSDG